MVQYPIAASVAVTVNVAVPFAQIVWSAPTFTAGAPVNSVTVTVNGVPWQVIPPFVKLGVTV